MKISSWERIAKIRRVTSCQTVVTFKISHSGNKNVASGKELQRHAASSQIAVIFKVSFLAEIKVSSRGNVTMIWGTRWVPVKLWLRSEINFSEMKIKLLGDGYFLLWLCRAGNEKFPSLKHPLDISGCPRKVVMIVRVTFWLFIGSSGTFARAGTIAVVKRIREETMASRGTVTLFLPTNKPEINSSEIDLWLLLLLLHAAARRAGEYAGK